jgi:hypothetical protein
MLPDCLGHRAHPCLGAARIAVAAPLFPGAVCGYVISEGKNLFVPTIARDQVGQPIATPASAFRALDPQQTELADQVGEDDRAVARHEMVGFDRIVQAGYITDARLRVVRPKGAHAADLIDVCLMASRSRTRPAREREVAQPSRELTRAAQSFQSAGTAVSFQCLCSWHRVLDAG